MYDSWGNNPAAAAQALMAQGWDPLGPGQGTAALAPPSNFQYGRDPNVVWVRPQLLYPEPQIAAGPGIGYFPRDRSLSFTGLTINQATVQTLRFEVPGPIYGITAGVRLDTGGALPAYVNPRDNFRVEFKSSNGELFTADGAVMGSTVCGTAQWPRLTSRSGWIMDTGGALVVTVTPLIADLEVDFTFYHYEVRGPTNVSKG